MAMRKKERVEGPGRDDANLPGCDFQRRWPALWGFLADTLWEDGSERELGTLLLCVGEGRARAWLNDKAQGVSCWVSSSTLEGVLDAAEAALSEDTGEWRRAKVQSAPKRR